MAGGERRFVSQTVPDAPSVDPLRRITSAIAEVYITP